MSGNVSLFLAHLIAVTIRPVTGVIAYALYIRLPEIKPFGYSNAHFSFNNILYINVVAQLLAAMTTLDMLLVAEESLHKCKRAQQLTSIKFSGRWCWMNGSRIQSINA